MIHFYDDWDYYPEATIQDNTKNTSFLRYVDSLSAMGINNNLWPLALHNPDLKDVDPFDPDIDPVTADLVVKEMQENFWYYVREVARLPGQGTAEPQIYRAHRGNMAFGWVHHLCIDVNCTLPRQSGKSVGADTNNNYHVNVGGEGIKVQLYTKDNRLRVENVNKLKGMRDLLPPYANFFDEKTDSDNNAEVTCLALKNYYLTAVAQKTVEGAENTGRGMTSPLPQIDEFPYCYNCHHSVPAMLGSTTAVVDLAKVNGTPYGVQITTTAGSRTTPEGKYAYEFIHGGIDWNEQLLDCKDRDEVMEFIMNNRRGKMKIINVTLNHRQLGKTDEWVMEKIRGSGSNREQAERDYLNVWTTGGVSSPLSATILNAIRNAVVQPQYIEMTKDRFMINWHTKKNELENYLDNNYTAWSLDSSNAVGGDGNALQVLDMKNLGIMGSCNVNIANLATYSIWLAKQLIKYPKATLIVENKSSGQAIMDTIARILIKHGHNPFERMYNRVIQEGRRGETRYEEVLESLKSGICTPELYEKYKKLFGFMTTGRTRDYLYDALFRNAAESVGHLVRDQETASQLLALEKKNERIDHPAGGNDDMVISWLFGNHLVRDGKNLSDYGIPKGLAGSEISTKGAIMSPEEIEKLRVQSTLKEKVNSLKEELKATNDEFRRAVIQTKLTRLVDMIEDEDVAWTMDAIIEECTPKKVRLADAVRGRGRGHFGY